MPTRDIELATVLLGAATLANAWGAVRGVIEAMVNLIGAGIALIGRAACTASTKEFMVVCYNALSWMYNLLGAREMGHEAKQADQWP